MHRLLLHKQYLDQLVNFKISIIEKYSTMRTRWRLFQKRVVCTKSDIYVFISISPRGYQYSVFRHWHGLLHEEFDDTKGAIRIRISEKNRQNNGQKKKIKRTNNDLYI